MSFGDARRRIVPLVCLLGLSGGCASIPGFSGLWNLLPFTNGRSSGFTQEDLRADVSSYAARFAAGVVSAAEEVTSGTTDPEIRRRALLWKVRITPLIESAELLGDPEQSYVALYALALGQRDYLESGAGRDIFGASQDVAVKAAQAIVDDGVAIGRRFLTPEQMARLTQETEAVVALHPIRGIFVPENVQAVVSATAPGGQFDWIVNYPLAPFRAVEGVESGARAIREFNVTAQRFSQIVATMPQRLRWQAELLAFEMEQRPTVETTRRALESMAASAVEFRRIADRLPAELRAELVALVEQIDRTQPGLRTTLTEARSTLVEARSTAEQLGPVTSALERTATEAQRAGVAWAGLVAELRAPSPADPGAAPARPFDITEYERTAASLATAAVELRGLVADARAMGMEASILDLAAWRALQLLVAFFVLLFVYRRIEGAFARRRGPRTGG